VSSLPATHCIVHPWWTFKWSECVCEECASAFEQKATDPDAGLPTAEDVCGILKNASGQTGPEGK
jgi:hypothetical protein